MKKNNILFCLAVFFVVAAAFSALKLSSERGDTVVIMSDGEIYAELSLDTDTSVSVKGKNTVSIENGEVYISYADCPDELCKKQGKIKNSEKTIVCLPNKMTVKIKR